MHDSCIDNDMVYSSILLSMDGVGRGHDAHHITSHPILCRIFGFLVIKIFFFLSLFFFFTVLLNCLFGHHNHAITLSYRSELAKCVLIEETYELRARAKVKLMYSLGQILISHFTRTLEKNYIKITLNGGIASSPQNVPQLM